MRPDRELRRLLTTGATAGGGGVSASVMGRSGLIGASPVLTRRDPSSLLTGAEEAAAVLSYFKAMSFTEPRCGGTSASIDTGGGTDAATGALVSTTAMSGSCF